MTPEAVIFPPVSSVFATDWRFETAFRVSSWLEAEYDWWQVNLGWDLRAAWAAVEPARARGELPGLGVEDADGALVGWGFFLRHRDVLQVASLVADEPAATEALVDGVLASSEADGASLIVSFTRAQAPGLSAALEARGFEVEIYRYLEVPTAGFASVDARVQPWGAMGAGRLSALLSRAYAGWHGLRPFAPRGLPEEWAEYSASLVERDACGRFMPDASGVIPARHDADPADPDALDGAIVVTSIGERTAHIAQVAVDPSARGNGLGAQLVCAAAAKAHAQGFDRLTLLVASGNARAAALYAHLGFEPTAAFLAAIRR